MSVNITPFGILPDGDEARCVALFGGGLEAEVLTYGGALRSLRVPSRRGPLDVALGFDSLEAYRAQTGFCGAIVGRCANRIGGSRFTLGGREYLLPKNDGENHLHGGPAVSSSAPTSSAARPVSRWNSSLCSPSSSMSPSTHTSRPPRSAAESMAICVESGFAL